VVVVVGSVVLVVVVVVVGGVVGGVVAVVIVVEVPVRVFLWVLRGGVLTTGAVAACDRGTVVVVAGSAAAATCNWETSDRSASIFFLSEAISAACTVEVVG